MSNDEMVDTATFYVSRRVMFHSAGYRCTAVIMRGSFEWPHYCSTCASLSLSRNDDSSYTHSRTHSEAQQDLTASTSLLTMEDPQWRKRIKSYESSAEQASHVPTKELLIHYKEDGSFYCSSCVAD